MKVAYLCQYGHVTVIKIPEKINGQIGKVIQCTHLHCGVAASIHEGLEIDDRVTATHVFYKPGAGDIVTLEEVEYCNKGGLLFKEIPGNQPNNVINEIRNTEEVYQLARFLAALFPERVGILTPVETAINIIGGNNMYEYAQQHDAILAFLKEKGIDPYDEKDMTKFKDLSTVVIGILKAYL